MTDYPRDAWQDPSLPITGPWPKAARTVGVIHYSGGDSIPDDKPAWLRSMQVDYVNNRGYSLGYGHLVVGNGDSYEIRGDDFNMASNPGDKCDGNANDWTLSILLDVTTTSAATPPAIATCRRIFAAAGITARPVPHQHYDYTACCGETVCAQIDAGLFDADQTEPQPPDPTPEDDMGSTFIIINNETGQPALVYGDGRLTGLAGGDLAGYVARFGDPIPTDPVVFNDMAGKG